MILACCCRRSVPNPGRSPLCTCLRAGVYRPVGSAAANGLAGSGSAAQLLHESSELNFGDMRA